MKIMGVLFLFLVTMAQTMVERGFGHLKFVKNLRRDVLFLSSHISVILAVVGGLDGEQFPISSKDWKQSASVASTYDMFKAVVETQGGYVEI